MAVSLGVLMSHVLDLEGAWGAASPSSLSFELGKF